MISREFTDYMVLASLIFIVAPKVQKPILSRLFTRMVSEHDDVEEEFQIDLTTMTIYERGTFSELDLKSIKECESEELSDGKTIIVVNPSVNYSEKYIEM